MLGQIPTSTLGRQIANRTNIHESWGRTSHRALVTPATSQKSCCHCSGPSATFASRLHSHAMFKDRLNKRRDGGQQAVAMHAATGGANGATLGQTTETPAGPASTSPDMQQGKLSSMNGPVQDSLIQRQALLLDSSQLVANPIRQCLRQSPLRCLEVRLLGFILWQGLARHCRP